MFTLKPAPLTVGVIGLLGMLQVLGGWVDPAVQVRATGLLYALNAVNAPVKLELWAPKIVSGVLLTPIA